MVDTSLEAATKLPQCSPSQRLASASGLVTLNQFKCIVNDCAVWIPPVPQAAQFSWESERREAKLAIPCLFLRRP
jgi:hypothetical protein